MFFIKDIFLKGKYSEIIRKNLAVVPINEEIIDICEKIIEKYKLLPNDALIAATCKYYGISKIATFDEDFQKVDFLKVVKV